MWPPVSPNTPLFSRMQVTPSPRRGVQHLLEALVHHVAVALQREDDRVGKHALHAGGDRRCATVQRLHEVDVHRAAEARVATDAGYPDRTRRDAELDERFEVAAHGDRLAAARAHVVLLGEQQIGEQRLDGARADGRGRRVETGPSEFPSVSSVRLSSESRPPGAVRARSGTRRFRGSPRAASRCAGRGCVPRSRRRRAAVRRRSRSCRSTRRR